MTVLNDNEVEAGVASFDNDADKWQAVMARDRTADGRFYYSVVTTGVYCRPSCSARRPLRENVRFHASRADAEAAGFRPCKRCKPDRTAGWDERCAMVERACRFIEQAETPPTLAEIAGYSGLSPYHFHRVFKEVTGITPRAYAASHRTRTVRGTLKSSGTVTEAIYGAGYNASSRFYAEAGAVLGMPPKAFKSGGKGQRILYAIRPCSLGMMLLAATDKGVCALRFGDDEADLKAALERDFSDATLAPGDSRFESWVHLALELVETGKQPDADLPLDIRGTAFQQKVWQALRQIPAGRTASYKEVAERIGKPAAVRAVAGACASNPIAVAIPCHRVVRSDGSLSGYRWGTERKKALLEREKKA